MGIEPFLISSTIRGILAQRLGRKICQKCKEAYIPDEETLRHFGLRAGVKLYKGKGCHACNNTGYKGRCGIFEFLVPDFEVKKMVLDRSSADEIKAYLVKKGGFDTLRRDGLRKAVEGITTVEQVIGVSQND
jgi:type IV pilus assembly protein PilB